MPSASLGILREPVPVSLYAVYPRIVAHITKTPGVRWPWPTGAQEEPHRLLHVQGKKDKGG